MCLIFCTIIRMFQVMHLDAEKEMMSQCVALLGKFIAVREPNIRYLGLVSFLNCLGTFFRFFFSYYYVKENLLSDDAKR